MGRHSDVIPLGRLPRGLAVLALAAAAWPAAAFEGRCESLRSGTPQVRALEGADAYTALPGDCLRSMFLQCSEAADNGLLGPASAMACSVAYEALRRKEFGGDFEALLAWWRSTRAGR